jgi:thymidylate synthase (FAD)
MANMTLEIHTTRAISPQILRHRSFTFQEFSQRYANTNEIGRIEVPHLRSQDQKNRQNSTDDLATKVGKPRFADLYRRVQCHLEDAEHLYQELLSSGVAKESARFILPTAAPTKLFMNGTLRSWIHYIDLRTTPGTQAEHRVLAKKAKDIFHSQFPIISEAVWPAPN